MPARVSMDSQEIDLRSCGRDHGQTQKAVIKVQENHKKSKRETVRQHTLLEERRRRSPRVAKAKPKRWPARKVARPVAPAVESIAVEHPAREFEK
jgi:hypothetical protein